MKTKLSIAFLVAVAGCGGSGSTKVDLGTSGDGGGADDMAMGGGKDLASNRDMTQINCDPNAQDCADPMKKCTEIPLDQAMTMLDPECVAVTGMKAIGDSCTRDMDIAGHDDCAKGGFCSSIGSYFYPPPMGQMPNRHCRAFCAADSDCKNAGEKCSVLDATNGVGLCAPTCTFFGTDCMQGYHCSVIIDDADGKNIYGTCGYIGQVAVGMACKTSIDCVQNAICNIPMGQMMGTCAALCDKSHACAKGACMPLTMTGLANGLGICQ